MKKDRNGFRRLVYSTLAASLMATALPLVAGAEAVMEHQAVQPADASTQPVAPAAPAAVQDAAVITKEKAIEIAQSIAGNVEGFEGPQVTRTNGRFSPYESRNVWEVRWIKQGPPYAHVEVAVDAESGLIRNYYRNIDGGRALQLPPKLKYEEAVKIGQEFAAKHYGQLLDKYQLDERPGEDWGKVIRGPYDAYEVRLVEKIQGIPFQRNQISIRVLGNGEIESIYYNSMENVKFADPKGILSKEEILKRLDQSLQMRLAYQTEPLDPRGMENGEQPDIKLSYQPHPNFYMLDAKTGEAIDSRGKVIKADDAGEQPLAAAKQAEPPQKLAKPLTEEEALKRLQQKIEIPKEVTIASANLEEWGGRKIWNFHYEYHTLNHGTGWQGGRVDAETGEVLGLDTGHYLREKYQQKLNAQDGENQEAKTFPVSLEQAKQQALAYVKANSKDKLHQLYISAQPVEEPGAYDPFYRFRFERRVGEILLPANWVMVAVSAETGEVVEFSQEWNWNWKLPEAGQVIDPAQAKQTYMKNVDVRLEYQITDEERMYRPPGISTGQKPLEARLVYRLVQNAGEPVYIDARTGKQISFRTGKELTGQGSAHVYKDIQGHWAEKELNYLAELGALKAEEGQLRPNEPVSRGQFIEWFAKVVEPHFYDRYYPGMPKRTPTFKDVPADHKQFQAIEWAVQQGVLDKAETFRPDEGLTREEAAQWIVNALGYGKLADREQIFRLTFADTEDIEHPGEVAIVSGIGIMGGDGSRFNPDQTMTRAEAAVTFFKFLEKRAEYRPDVRF